MGEVVGVAAGQVGIERLAERPGVGGAVEELDDVLVIPQGPLEDRADVPVAHRGPARRRGRGDRHLDLLVDQVLAEGRERVLGPAR